MKSSLSIWLYVVSVKSALKIFTIFVAFLENMNFTPNYPTIYSAHLPKTANYLGYFWEKNCHHMFIVHGSAHPLQNNKHGYSFI